jgi:hypothetical protein
VAAVRPARGACRRRSPGELGIGRGIGQRLHPAAHRDERAVALGQPGEQLEELRVAMAGEGLGCLGVREGREGRRQALAIEDLRFDSELGQDGQRIATLQRWQRTVQLQIHGALLHVDQAADQSDAPPRRAAGGQPGEGRRRRGMERLAAPGARSALVEDDDVEQRLVEAQRQVAQPPPEAVGRQAAGQADALHRLLLQQLDDLGLDSGGMLAAARQRPAGADQGAQGGLALRRLGAGPLDGRCTRDQRWQLG